MIEHKIVPGTPDEVCRQCNQFYGGGCVAFQVAHSDAEQKARENGNYGMECDDDHIKEIRWRRFGMVYRTPEGKYGKPFDASSAWPNKHGPVFVDVPAQGREA